MAGCRFNSFKELTIYKAYVYGTVMVVTICLSLLNIGGVCLMLHFYNIGQTFNTKYIQYLYAVYRKYSAKDLT